MPKLIVVEKNADRVVSLTPKKHGLLSNPPLKSTDFWVTFPKKHVLTRIASLTIFRSGLNIRDTYF